MTVAGRKSKPDPFHLVAVLLDAGITVISHPGRDQVRGVAADIAHAAKDLALPKPLKKAVDTLADLLIAQNGAYRATLLPQPEIERTTKAAHKLDRALKVARRTLEIPDPVNVLTFADRVKALIDGLEHPLRGNIPDLLEPNRDAVETLQAAALELVMDNPDFRALDRVYNNMTVIFRGRPNEQPWSAARSALANATAFRYNDAGIGDDDFQPATSKAIKYLTESVDNLATALGLDPVYTPEVGIQDSSRGI